MVIALHGKMGSGKSTIANQLVAVLKDQYNVESVIKSFAQPIYQLTSTIFDESIDNIKKSKHTIFRPRNYSLRSYRELLQNIGMELRDIVGKAIWINALFGNENSKILHDWTGNGCRWWIIDDLRFLNEYQRIKSMGGKVFKIFRDTPDMHKEILNNVRNNRSELDLDAIPNDSWDLLIDNNNSLDFSKDILEKYITTLLNSDTQDFL